MTKGPQHRNDCWTSRGSDCRTSRPAHDDLAKLLAGAFLVGACSAGPLPVRSGNPPASTASNAPTAAPSSSPASAVDLTRKPLGLPADVPLAVELVPIASSAHVLAVAVDETGTTWARTIDEDGTLGTLRRFENANLVTVQEGADERTSFVTSDGDRLCVATFKRGSDTPAERGCETIRPEMVVPIGDRLALLSLDVTEPKIRIPSRTKSPPAAKKSSKPKAPKKGASKKKPSKKKPAKKKRSSSRGSPTPSSKAKVDVSVAWATRAGSFDLASKKIGLTFERPLSGMMLIDAAPRGDGADLLFYEHVARPKKRSKSPYGSARFGIAHVGADAMVVQGARIHLAEDDLEYGQISGWNAPRILTSASGTAIVAFASRRGSCRAQRVFPSTGSAITSRVGCQIDPLTWALGDNVPPEAAVSRLLASEPRSAPHQTKGDAPLAVWAGSRAFFMTAADGSTFGTATRADGTPSAMAPPIVARRSRIAWSAFAPDGDGIALAAGKLFRIDKSGAVSEAFGADLKAALGARGALLVQSAGDSTNDRRRAARIGDSFFLAHEDLIRLTPQPKVIDALAGRAHPDGTALAGGSERGALIEVSGGMLHVTWITEEGDKAPGPFTKSPVRAGFDATERASGGALVAGAQADDPTKVVAFTLDAKGTLGSTKPTSLRIDAGRFGVRLTPLPAGGALLTDIDRRHVVWLDDDATERAAIDLPVDHASATCLDGRPAPLSVPSPEPGRLVRIPQMSAAGSCLRGDVAWTSTSGARWFGATVRGLESIADAHVVNEALAATAPATPVASGAATAPSNTAQPPSGKAPAKLACPSEMVFVAGEFCIDRFESMLVDKTTSQPLSPDYPPTPNLLEIVLSDWATDRRHWGDVHARAFPLPPLDAWRREAKTEPMAVVRFGARPNGYATGLVADSACALAGKRLCTLDEFTTACRGEADTDFPYGPDYQDGVCNVFREDHPAAWLHHNASFGHLDPRLNRVRANGRPLFETSGARPMCRSEWGDDAVYDLVGNLDEWVDEEGGAFAGGFYARSTRAGCDAVITAHPRAYADYSTGIRCCKDASQ